MMHMLLAIILLNRSKRRNDRASPPLRVSRLLGIVICDEQLSSLAVSTWLGVGNFDDSECALPATDLMKDLVHFFQRSVGSFGV